MLVNRPAVKSDGGHRILTSGLCQSMEFPRVNVTPCSLGPDLLDEWETRTVTKGDALVLVGHINVI